MSSFKDRVFLVNGRKQYLLGINYLPARWGHTDGFWQAPDLAQIERDFVKIKEMGCTVIRLPLPLTVMKKAGVIDPIVLPNFEKVLDLAARLNILVVPNLFHTGGWFNTDWVMPDTAFSSPEVLKNEEKILRHFMEPYKSDPRIIAWDACNEPWWIFGTAYHKDKNRARFRPLVSDWIKKFSAIIREIGPSQPFTVGVDHAGISQEVGADADAITAQIDFSSPHFYSRYIIGALPTDTTNSLRDSYYGPFVQTRLSRPGKPVAPFEFGNSTQFLSEKKMADNLRTLFHSSVTNGACAWFPWVFQDFGIECREYYQNQTHEIYFGMFREDGSEKPSVAEFRRFAKLLPHLDPEKYSRPPIQAAIVPGKDWYGHLDFNTKASFNAFCLAKEAGIDTEFSTMVEDWSPYKLVISLTTDFNFTDMDKIQTFVAAGGTFITSASGIMMNIRYMQELLGVSIEEVLRIDEDFAVTAAHAWGGLSKGEQFTLAGSLGKDLFFDSVSAAGCDVIMRDGEGRPCLTVNKHGKGHIAFLAFPLDFLMGIMPWSHRRIPAWKIYRGLRDLAGLHREINAEHPSIETGIFKGTTETIALFINHDDFAVTAPVTTLFTPREVVEVTTGKKVSGSQSVSLGPNEIVALKFVR